MTCKGCEHLRSEKWPKGITAVRCMAAMPSPWGKGRVLSTFPGEVVLSGVQRPLWCTKDK